MNTQLKSVIFALVVVATNWHWEKKVEGTIGTVSKYSTTTRIDGAGLWILVCIIAFIVFGRRLYKDVRLLLDQSVRVPKHVKVVALWPIVFLLPLFLSASYTFTTDVDNTLTTTSSGYGSKSSTTLFILASLVIATYQAGLAIKSFVPESKA